MCAPNSQQKDTDDFVPEIFTQIIHSARLWYLLVALRWVCRPIRSGSAERSAQCRLWPARNGGWDGHDTVSSILSDDEGAGFSKNFQSVRGITSSEIARLDVERFCSNDGRFCGKAAVRSVTRKAVYDRRRRLTRGGV